MRTGWTDSSGGFIACIFGSQFDWGSFVKNLALFISSVALIAAAPAKKLDPNAPTIQITMFDRAIASAKADMTRPKDEFSPTPSVVPGFDKTPFKMVKPLSRRDNSVSYSYKEGVLIMSVSVRHFGEYNSKVKFLLINAQQTYGDSFTGQNAYGARVEVTRSIRQNDGLVLVTRPKGDYSPYYKPTPYYQKPIGDDGDSYWVKLTIDGPSAKALMMDTDVVYEGIFFALDGQPSGICDTKVDKAKINAPVEETETTCAVPARVSRVTFVKRSTGEIIKEYIAP
jgi:hypothetical protein